jgi:hypothetical protein
MDLPPALARRAELLSLQPYRPQREVLLRPGTVVGAQTNEHQKFRETGSIASPRRLAARELTMEATTTRSETRTKLKVFVNMLKSINSVYDKCRDERRNREHLVGDTSVIDDLPRMQGDSTPKSSFWSIFRCGGFRVTPGSPTEASISTRQWKPRIVHSAARLGGRPPLSTRPRVV